MEAGELNDEAGSGVGSEWLLEPGCAINSLEMYRTNWSCSAALGLSSNISPESVYPARAMEVVVGAQDARKIINN